MGLILQQHLEHFPWVFLPPFAPGSIHCLVGDSTGTTTAKTQFNTIRGYWWGMGTMPCRLRQGLRQPWSKLLLASSSPELLSLLFLSFSLFLFILLVSLFNSLSVSCSSSSWVEWVISYLGLSLWILPSPYLLLLSCFLYSPPSLCLIFRLILSSLWIIYKYIYIFLPFLSFLHP